jgi:hypothetical protein
MNYEKAWNVLQEFIDDKMKRTADLWDEADKSGKQNDATYWMGRWRILEDTMKIMSELEKE